MENPAILLWIPIILRSLLSIVKLINKGGPNGKPGLELKR